MEEGRRLSLDAAIAEALGEETVRRIASITTTRAAAAAARAASAARSRIQTLIRSPCRAT
jgi:hypothetical protein